MSVTWNIIDNHSEINGTHDLSFFANGVWTAQAHVELRDNVPFLTAFDVNPGHYGHGVAAEFYKALSGLESLPVLIDPSLATIGNERTAADNLIHRFDGQSADYSGYFNAAWNWNDGFEPNLLELAKTNPAIAEQIELMKLYMAVLEAENASVL